MEKQKWEGQIEKVQMEYTISAGEHNHIVTEPMSIMVGSNEIPIDKTDCLIAASSGILTAMLDVLWVGEFSLSYAQDVGTEQINNLVIAIAKRDSFSKGKRCPKDDLKSCIRYLEKEYPLASDKLTNEFGNGLNHHLRDFSHHASPFGLICSILNQFTKRGYGTDTDGRFIRPEIPATDTIGETFEEKITLGVVDWFFHLVSDMAGSSSSIGRGTGIPGPILSLAKVLSATPLFRELKIRYKNDDIGFSIWVSKLFNGTAFEHTSHKDIIRFDLRTEIGIGSFAIKQSIAVRFVLYDTSDGKWSVQLCGLKTFDESIPSYEWKENFSSRHNLCKWDRISHEEETVHTIAKAVSEYLLNGLHKNKLSIYQAVSVESRFHTEYPYKNK